MRVAIVHDWLDTYRGGEKVLEEILEIFPDAPIYTLFYRSRDLPQSITKRKIIYPAFLNRLSRIRKALLPFLPAQIESFDLNEFDLVISTSSCVAKGAITRPDAKHICYIHSPMRYVWDQREHYLGSVFRIPILGLIARHIASRLRVWDVTSAQRVDLFVANSTFVQRRVEKYYGKQAKVLHPPVAIDRFKPTSAADEEDSYFLVAGAFVSYKRFDLAIQACNQLNLPLVVAGSGPGENALRSMAGSTIRFEISPSQEDWEKLMSNAKALIYPGIEDFGIVPIEAMASGTPVVAFKGGGALDFIQNGVNGVFFSQSDAACLIEALKVFDERQFDKAEIRSSVQEFSEARFKRSFQRIVEEVVGE